MSKNSGLEFFERFCGAVAWLVGHDFHASAIILHGFGFGDLIEGVVAALEVDIGLEMGDEVAGGVIVAGFCCAEEHDHIDGGQRAKHGRAGVFVVDGAVFALEQAHGIICVQADDEAVTACAGIFEVADMAVMEDVETAIGETDAKAPRLPALSGFAGLVPAHNRGVEVAVFVVFDGVFEFVGADRRGADFGDDDAAR